MIGDWVCVTKNFTQKYHQIRALSNDEEDVLKGTYINDYGVECHSIFSMNDTQPIPLTPEILEKNGIKRDTNGRMFGEYFDEDKNGFLEISVDCEGIWWSINYEEYHILRFKYVHELQHALRLCGIDKEIKL